MRIQNYSEIDGYCLGELLLLLALFWGLSPPDEVKKPVIIAQKKDMNDAMPVKTDTIDDWLEDEDDEFDDDDDPLVGNKLLNIFADLLECILF